MKPDFMAVLAAAIALDKKRRKWEFVPVKTVAGAHSPEVVTVAPEPEPTPPGVLDTFQADTFQNDAFQ